MRRKIITTADGSKTIHIEEWNEQYHSKHGAIQEANHVFIKEGLTYFLFEFIAEPMHEISILEIGFGTGLNALLSALEVNQKKINVNYVGVEAYPISSEEITSLNYAELISEDALNTFSELHNTPWEEFHNINPFFNLLKRQQFFHEIQDINQYDIIYFDAFGARVQPELWTEAIFECMYNALKPNGILSTYSAKGSVKRAMKAVGFEVERLEGPPGKRHMLRAIKRNANNV